MKHITILGWTGGFGKWLAEYILRNFSHISDSGAEKLRLTITGRNTKKWQDAAKEIWAVYIQDNQKAVQDADIVIYAVSIAYMQETIESTLDALKAWAIVLDVTSVKQMPVKAFSQARKDIIVIPTHPMFGPYILDIAGQVIVLTADEWTQKKQEYQILIDFLRAKKARVIESTPKYHDQIMAVVQWLTHLSIFVMAETMKRLQFDISASMDFVSPIYKIMVSSVGRYLSQNPWLYADIQIYNSEIWKVHENFLDAAKDFHTSIKDRDIQAFCSDRESAREFFGEENCQIGHAYTDKIIYLLWRQVDLIKENIGNRVTLKDIYSWEVIEGQLVKYENNKIFLDSGECYSIDFYELIV